MAGDSGYATNLRVIPIDFFVDMIKDGIKTLIHTYGHKDCGLRHKELCEEIKKIIFNNKKILYEHMDSPSKKEWDTKWDRQRNGIFHKLFDNEGFINMCFPLKKIVNQSIYQLKSKHIKFCKEKEVRRAALVEKPEYNVCIQYNRWIDSQRTAFTNEYLENVKNFKRKSVNKSFITKEHPGGHDPRPTYHNSKLDCTQYNSPPYSYSKKPVEKAPPISLHSPSPPTVGQKSQGKTGSSATDQDNGSAETKLEENKFPIPKSHIPDSQISSLSKTQRGGTSNVKDTSVKTEDPGSPVNKDEGKKEETSKKNEQLTNGSPSAQAEPPPHAKSPPLSPSADAKDQDSAPQSSTTSGTLASTHSNKSVLSTAPTDSSLPQPQVPVLTVSPVVTTANETGTSAFSSASAITTTSTTTTAAPTTVTLSTVSTTQHPISSLNQASGINGSKEPPPLQVAREPKATTPNKEPQQTVEPTPTPVSGSDTGELLDPTQPATDDVNKQTSLSREASSEHKDTRPKPGTQSSNIISQTSGEKPDNFVVATDVKQTRTIYKIDPMHITSSVQIGTNGVNDQLTPHVSGYPGKIPDVKSGKDPINNPITQKGKNNNPNAISEGIPPLTHIIPTLLVILATLTLLFQLYKYTPFGFLLGRRRKRKKQDLKRIFEIPEKPAYEYPNITVHEWEDPNLVGKAVENDVYTKLLKINRYKQEMQKRKKENKKTLIEVHMEVLEEYKSDEWELHKGDFLEICLRGFINEENDNYSKLPNIELTAKSTKNDKIIENIQKHEILWNNWIENHRNILEQWKKEDWFQNLKNEWKNEEHMYKEKNDKLQENILNEEEKHSIVSQKDIWRKWISKQANLIDIFNKEDWFKSMVYAQDKEKDNYHINEYNNVTVTTETQLKNEKPNHEYSRSKGIIQKFMVQIHMMVLEECIKEEIIKQKELCIDNFIEDIHTQNNYDEKRNVPQCNTDNFNVLKYDEIHTSKNK